MSSVRLLLSLAAEYNWDLVHLDVKTAFLQSELKEEIYVWQPRGFEEHGPSGAPYACRLRRSLYGLCQSPAWRTRVCTSRALALSSSCFTSMTSSFQELHQMLSTK
ncbi:unnamed protein product [Discosporangium mesarthrocarpum]